MLHIREVVADRAIKQLDMMGAATLAKDCPAWYNPITVPWEAFPALEETLERSVVVKIACASEKSVAPQ